MSDKRFRVKDLVKYNYSEIGEYIDENHTDRPLRNDEVCDLLNTQQATIIKQKEEIKKLKRTERSWRRIHCCNKESDNCGIVIEQESTIKQLQGRIKRLNAFIVSKDLATEYVKWNKER